MADDRDADGAPADSAAGGAGSAAAAGVPSTEAAADAPTAGGGRVTIRVARSGGVAGMTRRWRVAPSDTEAERWVSMLERCPWDEDPGSSSGADRFEWRIEAQIREERHERVIPEEHLSGPWRDLVDAVQKAAQD